MRPSFQLIAAGLIASLLFCGLSASAGAQGSQSPGKEPQASPSHLPASQATPPAVKGQTQPAPGSQVGGQPAAPSQMPASQATPGAVQKDKGAGGQSK